MSNRKVIYLDDAIDALAEYIHNVDKVMGTGYLSAYDCKDAATSVLADLPPAQPRKGRWKGEGLGDYRCSLCGEIHTRTRTNFCPNCGADMRGDVDG